MSIEPITIPMSIEVNDVTIDSTIETNEVTIESTFDAKIEVVEGGDITVQSLTVTENGTTTAPTGKAYSPVIVNVPNTYTNSDEGKVVQNGALTAQTSTTKNANGTYDTTTNNQVTVSVPASAVDTGTKSISSNGTHDVVGYASAAVSVPNTYTASDEGKVVNNGALVSQTSATFTSNGTYDTTTNDEVVVNVSGSTPTLITKTITANGTYSAEDDDADGYSEVTVNVQGGGLPDIYQEVEYIYSSGTQAINTRIYPEPEIKAQVIGRFTQSKPSTALSVLGATVGSSTFNVFIGANSNGFYSQAFNDTSYITSSASYDQLQHDFVVEREINKTTFYVDNTSNILAKQAQTNNSSPLGLFARIQDSVATSIDRYVSFELRQCKMWHSFLTKYDTLIFDAIPCYRKSDGEIGLYDLVSGHFLTNIGSGVFGKGPDVISDSQALSILLGGE